MEYRRLGRSGVRVSVLGLGCNTFGTVVDEKAAETIVHYALDQGINFFDTANVYSHGLSEEFLGKALKGRRADAVIATKFGGNPYKHSPGVPGPNDMGGSRYYIMKAIDQSLRRLQTDHIDLYQMHHSDPTTPIEETLGTLDDLIHAGKVRYTGCSNIKLHQVYEAMETAKRINKEPFTTAQEEYNLLDRSIEAEFLPCCHAYGIGFVPFQPLKSGFLTGKYRRGQTLPAEGRLNRMAEATRRSILTDRNFDILEKLEDFAKQRNHTVGELAIAWLLSHSWVPSVIAGSSKPEQIKANLKGIEWKLTPEEITEIDAII